MFSQDESHVMVVIVSVCVWIVCEPLLSVTREIKDAHPVVHDVGGKRNGRKKDKMGRERGRGNFI